MRDRVISASFLASPAVRWITTPLPIVGHSGIAQLGHGKQRFLRVDRHAIRLPFRARKRVQDLEQRLPLRQGAWRCH